MLALYIKFKPGLCVKTAVNLSVTRHHLFPLIPFIINIYVKNCLACVYDFLFMLLVLSILKEILCNNVH